MQTSLHYPSNRPLTLSSLQQGEEAVVTGLGAPAHNTVSDELLLRLLEIGFVEGERVRVVAKYSWLSQETPMVVRVGGTSFGLRAFEASCVHVLRVAEV